MLYLDISIKGIQTRSPHNSGSSASGGVGSGGGGIVTTNGREESPMRTSTSHSGLGPQVSTGINIMGQLLEWTIQSDIVYF